MASGFNSLLSAVDLLLSMKSSNTEDETKTDHDITTNPASQWHNQYLRQNGFHQTHHSPQNMISVKHEDNQRSNKKYLGHQHVFHHYLGSNKGQDLVTQHPIYKTLGQQHIVNQNLDESKQNFILNNFDVKDPNYLHALQLSNQYMDRPYANQQVITQHQNDMKSYGTKNRNQTQVSQQQFHQIQVDHQPQSEIGEEQPSPPLKRKRNAITLAQKDQIVKLRRQGASRRAIAEAFSISTDTVKNIIYRSGKSGVEVELDRKRCRHSRKSERVAEDRMRIVQSNTDAPTNKQCNTA